MASVHKRAKSKFWYAAFDVPVGLSYGVPKMRRVKKCTKTTSRSEAMRVALTMEEVALKKAGAGTERSQAVYQLLSTAAQQAARGALTKDLARDCLNQILETATGERLEFFTIRGWFEQYLAQKRGVAKPSTMKRYEHSLNSFLDSLGEKADRALEHLSELDITNFRDTRKREGRASKTVNGYVKDISGVLAKAVRDGLIRRNPALGIEKLPEDDSVSREPFTLEEVEKILAKCDDDWKGVVLLGFYGGLRLGDAARLEWESINFEARTITYLPAKTSRSRKRVLLPMHEALGAYLSAKAASAKETAGSVFLDLCSKPVGGRYGLSDGFMRIMNDAGVSRRAERVERGKTMAGRSVCKWSFHSLRHTAVSLMANGNVPDELRKKVVGHTSDDSHQIYTHHELETIRGAVAALPAVG